MELPAYNAQSFLGVSFDWLNSFFANWTGEFSAYSLRFVCIGIYCYLGEWENELDLIETTKFNLVYFTDNLRSLSSDSS